MEYVFLSKLVYGTHKIRSEQISIYMSFLNIGKKLQALIFFSFLNKNKIQWVKMKLGANLINNIARDYLLHKATNLKNKKKNN